MSARRALLLSVLAASLAVASVAHADDGAPEPPRPLALNLHLGLGTPFGRAGLALELTAWRKFSVEVGAGFGKSGQQLALAPRLRVFERQGVAASAGAGVSAGRFERRDPLWGVEYDSTIYRKTIWSNAELSLEGRSGSGLQLRVYLGAGVMLHGELEECSDGGQMVPCEGTDRGVIAGYGGVALGYAFPL